MMSVEGEKVYSVREVAQGLGYTDSYVRRLIRDGYLEASKVGKKWFVTEGNLSRALKANTSGFMERADRGAVASA